MLKAFCSKERFKPILNTFHFFSSWSSDLHYAVSQGPHLLDFIRKYPDSYRHQTSIWTPGTRRRMCCRSPCEAHDVRALRGPRGRPGVLLHRWGSSLPPTIRSGLAAASAARSSATKPWLIMKQKAMNEDYAEEGSRLVLISVWMPLWLRVYPWQRHGVISGFSVFPLRCDGMRRCSLGDYQANLSVNYPDL